MDKIFTNVKVKGIATALPEKKLELQSLASEYGEDYVNKVMQVTGIRAVHITEDGQTTSDLCTKAAKKLLDEGLFQPEDIDAIVFVSETPDYIIPNTSSVLQDRLGLRHDALVFDINFGCAGYVYGLFQAHMLISCGYAKNVLLCVGDTLSKTVHPGDKALRMVLGDAGSATLLSYDSDASPATFSFYTDGGRADKLMIPAGGFRHPRVSGVTDVAHEDGDGNMRSSENMYMDGMEVMEFALHEIKGVAQRVYGQYKITPDDVDVFALHQANEMIVKYVARKVKAPKNRVPIGLERTGNTSCTSIPLLLSTRFARQSEDLHRVFVCGFGTGLTCAAGILDLSSADIFTPEIDSTMSR